MKTRMLVIAALARAREWRPHFTRNKLALLGVTLVVAGLSLGGLDSTPPSAEAAFTRSLDLMLPPRDMLVPAEALATTRDAAADAKGPAEDWDEVKVRPGQTLDAIFRQEGFSIGLLQDILALNGDTGNLKRIRPGDVFGFQRKADGTLFRMRYPVDESDYLIVEDANGTLRADRLPRQVYSEVTEAQGVIDSSLFLAGKQAGLSDSMVMKLANIFGWDIDFVLDIRAGDRFYLVYEKIYREGEFLRDGDILAATFVNQGTHYQAFRFEVDGQGRYFDADGRPMRKAFLRAPLNFSYISSNFNPARFHPILKRVKPHNGIDYRAPAGTPVYAAGDGRVIRSTYNKYNGNYVFIQHANNIETHYLHFSRRAVKQGDRVHQGQVIGYVGATGLATAPHLHYEFVVNGVHRNPRTVSLPKVDPLQGNVLASFRAQAAPFQNRLNRLESASLYASQ